MIHTIINADYDYETNDINLYTRNEKNKRCHVKVIDFKPYFFIPRGEELESTHIVSREEPEIKSIHNEELSLIYVEKPRDVKALRQKVSRHYEGDILFPRRMMVDSGVYASFEVPEDRSLVSWKKLKPCKKSCKIRKAYCDIETYSKEKRRFPLPTDEDAMVTLLCIYDSWKKIYLSIVQRKDFEEHIEKYAENHYVVFLDCEKELLERVHQYLIEIEPDVFTAWYLPYDRDYLDERAKKHHIEYPWNKTNPFDLLEAYKRLFHKGSNELADVVKSEHLNTPNYKKYKHEMWEAKDLREAILTNKSHVESIVILDEKKNLINFYWDLKNVVGLENITETLWHGKLVDIMLLRHYHNKWVLPSSPTKEEMKRRKEQNKEKTGGGVFDPMVGIFTNLAVFDMTRYYVEMLIAQNISPEPHGNELGVIPTMALELVNTRLEYDKLLSTFDPGTEDWKWIKFQRNSVKYVTEAIIGDIGSESSRVYDPDDFNKITQMGKRGLLFLKKVCNRDGYEVIYGDTDGATVKLPDVEIAKKYVNVLNKALKEEFCKEEKIDRELSLKLDRFWSVYGIKRLKKRTEEERGVKKRYFGRVVWEDGKPCDYLSIVGFEYVRRDAPLITKQIQPAVFDLILEGKKEQVKEYLKTEVKKIRQAHKEGKLSLEDIAIPITLCQPISEYGKDKNGFRIGIPDYVRGAIYSNDYLKTEIRGGDQVKMLYVENIKGYPPTDVVSCLDVNELPPLQIDLEKMIDRCVRKKIEDVIELIGLSWDSIFSKKGSII